MNTDTYRETVRAAARTANGPCRRHPQRRRMARPCHGMIAITGVVNTTTACPGETLPGYDVLRGGRRAESASDFRLVDLDRMETLSAALQGVDLVTTIVLDVM